MTKIKQTTLNELEKIETEEEKDNKLSIKVKEVKGPYELPEGWSWVKLGDIAEINKYSVNPPKDFPNKKFIYIDISGVENGTGKIKEVKVLLGKDAPSRARRLIHTNDILMSTVRPYLRGFAIVPSEYDNQVCSTGFAVLTPKREILPKFVLFSLFTDILMEQYKQMMLGAHYPALTNEQVNSLKIPIPFKDGKPDLEEQKRIVAKIEDLFSKIDRIKELRKQTKEEAENLLNATSHHVFSKAEEKGWKRVRLKDIAVINPPKSEINNLPPELEVSFIPMECVDDVTGKIIKQERRKLSEVKQGYTYFKEGDVLFAKITPCMENGKFAVARELVNGIGFGSTEFHVIRPIKEFATSDWIWFYLRQEKIRKKPQNTFRVLTQP